MTNIHPLRPARQLLGTVCSGPSTYAHLLATAAASRRCPVWFTDDASESLDRRWDAASALAQLDRRTAAEVLAERWPAQCGCGVDCLAPFGEDFPGLTPRPPVDPVDAFACALVEADERPVGRMVVVPVTRPADIPAATGWHGMINS